MASARRISRGWRLAFRAVLAPGILPAAVPATSSWADLIRTDRIHHLHHSVEWPARKLLSSKDDPQAIDLDGADGVHAPRQIVLAGRGDQDRPISLRGLFVGQADQEALLRPLHQNGVLTVNEAQTFLHHGRALSWPEQRQVNGRLRVAIETNPREHLCAGWPVTPPLTPTASGRP